MPAHRTPPRRCCHQTGSSRTSTRTGPGMSCLNDGRGLSRGERRQPLIGHRSRIPGRGTRRRTARSTPPGKSCTAVTTTSLSRTPSTHFDAADNVTSSDGDGGAVVVVGGVVVVVGGVVVVVGGSVVVVGGNVVVVGGSVVVVGGSVVVVGGSVVVVVEVDGAAVVAVVVLVLLVVDAPDTAVTALDIASAPIAAPASRSRRRRRSRPRVAVGDTAVLPPTMTTPLGSVRACACPPYRSAIAARAPRAGCRPTQGPLAPRSTASRVPQTANADRHCGGASAARRLRRWDPPTTAGQRVIAAASTSMLDRDGTWS